ncbi:MAG: zinc dependent phospholipase C family protein [Armatimonadota bacterium]
MLTKRLLALLIPIVCLIASIPAQAAGPMGHFIIARKVISNIAAGGFTAPNELKQLLHDVDCQRAFCGGAIGPDLVEAKSHYGDTSDLVQRLFYNARLDQKAAAKAKDAKAFAVAKKELAFSYGWVSHFIMDMNTHQLVNGMQGIGDAYGFTTQAQKLTHGIYEAQLCAYLRRTIWNPADKYDVLIPYAFVARVVGVSEPSVRQMSVVLKGKTALELVASGNCDLTTEKLATIWNKCVTTSLQEIARYLAAPESLDHWDMDVGHIGTGDFKRMRSMVIEINDGKLPSDWGKQYPVFWEAIQHLSDADKYTKLIELLGKTAIIPKDYRILLTLNPSANSKGYKEMPGDWKEPYLSVWLSVSLNGNAFSFEVTDKDPPGLGHMTNVITGSGTLTPKGQLSMKGEVTGGQSYVSNYGNGPDVRFVETDNATFELSGVVKFTRDNKGQIYRSDYVQSEFKGTFGSKMTITKMDFKGNEVSTDNYECSGEFVPKSSGVEDVQITK